MNRRHVRRKLSTLALVMFTVQVCVGCLFAQSRGARRPGPRGIKVSKPSGAGQQQPVVPSTAVPDPGGDAPRLVVKLGHASLTGHARFSPDGRQVLTVGDDSLAILWDVATGGEIRRFVGHSKGVYHATFSPDARYILTAGHDKTVRLWETATGKEVRRLEGARGDALHTTFSPDGSYILIGSRPSYKNGRKLSDDVVRLLDAKTWEPVQSFVGHSDTVFTIRFSRDGRFILTGGEDKTARLWETATGQEVKRFVGHGDAVVWADFSPDQRFVWTKSQYAYHRESSTDVSVRVWDIETGKESRRLESAGYPVAFSPDGRFLLASADDEKGTGLLLDAATGQEVRRYERITRPQGYSPDGRLVLAKVSNWFDVAWDAVTERPVQVFKGLSSDVQSAVFSPDGQQILTGSWSSGTAELWSLPTGGQVQRFVSDSGTVGSVAFSPDSRLVLTGGFNNFVRLWDARTGAEVRRFDKGDHVAFSPDGSLIATAEVATNGQEQVTLRDVATGAEVRRLIGRVSDIAFSPDGRLLLMGGHDKIARLWEVSTGKEVRRFRGLPVWLGTGTAVAFSPDGRTVLAGSPMHSFYPDHAAQLWDVKTGKELRRLKGHTGWVNSVAYSPDGRLLLTGSYDGTARLWDAATGRPSRRLEGHTSSVRSVAFSPDGQLILTAGGDSTTRVWRAETGEELCRLVSFSDGNWVVVDPDGRFDTSSLEEIKGLSWILPDDPFKPLPLEIFLRDYYEPRLLTRILAGEKFRPIKAVAELNRVQPGVEIKEILWEGESHDSVTVSVEVSGASGVFQRGGAKVGLETGAYDLRLFRDGQLVGYAPEAGGEVKIDRTTKKALVTFSGVKLPRRKDVSQIEFSAYAFNVDRVKSTTDREVIAYPKGLTPVKGRAYLITFGVNAYELEALDLSFAANDARRVQSVVSGGLSKAGVYEEVVQVPLISDYERRNGRRVIRENTATKVILKAVLNLLAGKQVSADLLKDIPGADKLRRAGPEDLVLLSFSSHGYADERGKFYLLPYDVGQGTEMRQLLGRAISSDELSLWLRDVDAGEMVMVVDACHSSAGVEGEGFKAGPMGSRGLGQLSYDKGMRILTSTQADNVALETDLTQMGLLTYALTHDGLEMKQADYRPQDRQITISEWLSYGADRVPKLYEELTRKGAIGVGRKSQAKLVVLTPGGGAQAKDNRELGGVSVLPVLEKPQQPSLFDFARRRQDVVLTRVQ